MTLTAKDVAEITRLLEESNFDELMLELDGLKLTLRRNGFAAAATSSNAEGGTAPFSQCGRPQTVSADQGLTPGAAPAVGPAPPIADGASHNISAPLLGTFYRAPKPGSPPFIEVGSTVEEDTIVGIIEVMKLMNTVRAGTRGRVVDILAQDGALVEYGETLMRVGKAAAA
ncbi:MAG TPA: acetyl-CoA carboxylase biotin carboxyl carrier protein [Steroidobacteraceae bacterium]